MRGGNVGQTVASGSGQGGGTVASGNHVVRGIVFAALGGICWGFSGTCAQLMTSGFGVPVSWITCVRLLLAAVIFLVVWPLCATCARSGASRRSPCWACF